MAEKDFLGRTAADLNADSCTATVWMPMFGSHCDLQRHTI